MTSTTMTIRLDSEAKNCLIKLAEMTHRTQSFLAAEAINEYLKVQQWQLNEIQNGIIEADAGQFLDHDSILKFWESKKTVKIIWTIGAGKNLHQIEEYISRNNPQAAIDIILKIIKSVDLLTEHPLIGKIGRIFDTRELIIGGTPFIVIVPYRIKSGNIEILRVLHSAMQWPKIL